MGDTDCVLCRHEAIVAQEEAPGVVLELEKTVGRKEHGSRLSTD